MSELSGNAEAAARAVCARPSFRSTAFCVAILLIGIVAAHPVANAGVIDDWAYIWSAKILSQTGHLVYQGWATAMLLWQLYLGALFAKLFGFSFTAVRASVAVLSLASAALLHRIFLRMGMNAWNASAATLCVVLCPLILPLEASFMSDIPGFFAILVCWYCVVRALQAQSDEAAVGWLVAAALSNDVLGTARQISWLGALVLVPSAAWCLRKRRGVAVTAILLWVSSVIFIAGCILWFRHQPYALNEALLFPYHRDHLWQLWRLALAGPLLLFPILLAYITSAGPDGRRFRHIPFWLGIAAGCCFVVFDKGAEFDTNSTAIAPVLASIPLAAKLMLVALSFAGLFCFLAQAGAMFRDRVGRIWVILLGPFTCAYMLLVITRAVVWQRYLLPVLAIFLFALVWTYTRRNPERRLPIISMVMVGVFALVGVAETHDLFAQQAARAAAVEKLELAGVPRWQIYAGDELDGWAQIEMTGYLNDPRLTVPAGAYRPDNRTGVSAECFGDLLDLTPSIKPRFELSYSPFGCFPVSTFPPVEFHTWLPPNDRKFYILGTPDAQATLSAR